VKSRRKFDQPRVEPRRAAFPVREREELGEPVPELRLQRGAHGGR
jgi:hypothetical protein